MTFYSARPEPVGETSPPPERMYLTFRYKLLVSKTQRRALENILENQRLLYNAALQERVEAWRKARVRISFFDQCKSLTQIRKADEILAATPANVQRWTLDRVNQAFLGFFGRVRRKKGKVGFPRFRPMSRWKTFGFKEMSGIRIDFGRVRPRIRMNGVPASLRIHYHRLLPKDAEIHTCSFTKDIDSWYVCLQISTVKKSPRRMVRGVGVDPGIKTLISLSDGTKIGNSKPLKRRRKQLRVLRRALTRCKRGSNRRKKVREHLAKEHRRIRNFRSTKLHQVSAFVTNRYDFIALEAASITGLARGRLAGEFQDAGWGRLFDQLRYKAERAGARIFMVDRRYTSQICSGCGACVPKSLDDRTHSCSSCGLELDRDINAARVILARAVVGPGLVNEGRRTMRRAGNFSLAPA
ncbi:RNA-guided endonuclease InsQ/TnpB family protein [Tepidicaulis sp. LMO-SS28]|uniref:RNA-guided endonuclease InsQ/TnpB family protein n=1 Tax=Tepidicaulis sp. LMO-SS28 TaxID=3447455 RepID=UPI003EDF171B